MNLFLRLIFTVGSVNFAVAQSGEKISSGSYADLKYKVFKNGNGWGYDILDKDNLLIHQPNIPGISGLRVFATSGDAGKIAGFAIMKIKKGIFPPTIVQGELDSLKIKK